MKKLFTLLVVASLALTIQAQEYPGGVTGTNLWLKANDGVTFTGTELDGWVDQTTTNTFTKTGTIGYHPDALNFNPKVSISNALLISGVPDNRLDGNTSIHYVDGFAVYLGTRNQYCLIGGVDQGTHYGPAIFAGDNAGTAQVAVGNGSNSVHAQADHPGLNSFNILNLDVSLLARPFATGRLNGGTLTMTSGNTTVESFDLKPMIGGTNNGTGSGWYRFDGEVAEMILYPTSLSGAEKLKIESYLAVKYGITLNTSSYVSSDGTVIWNNSSFWHDVFGIAKDDDSGLEQASSNSINTGSGNGTGQTGKGNIVLSSPSTLADGDFLMIGHDNGALSLQPGDVPAGLYQKRLGREWKVKHTNDVGTLSLSFELDGIITAAEGLGSNTSDFNILIDEDGNGDFTTGTVTQLNPTTVTGTLLQFTNVTLPEGAVFTFSMSLNKEWTNGLITGIWHTAGNWTPNGVPGPTDNVIITDVVGEFTTIAIPATCKDLTIETGAELEIAGTTLIYHGNVTVEGGGKLNLAGTATMKYE